MQRRSRNSPASELRETGGCAFLTAEGKSGGGEISVVYNGRSAAVGMDVALCSAEPGSDQTALFRVALTSIWKLYLLGRIGLAAWCGVARRGVHDAVR